MIEIARLQNSLLFSVPLNEYNRLSKQYKLLLCKETINNKKKFNSIVDEEYCLEETQLSIIDKVLF